MIAGARLRAPGLLLLGVVVAADGCAAVKNDSGGYTGGGGSAGGGTSGGGPGACQVTVSALSPQSFEGLSPGQVLRVRGDIIGAPPALFAWSWRAVHADGAEVPVTHPLAAEPAIAEVALTRAGTYTLLASLSGAQPACGGERTVIVAQPGGRSAAFRLRVTPPAAAALPAQDFVRQVIGGTPFAGDALALQPGVMVPLQVWRASNQARVGAYLRLTEMSSGAVIEARANGEGTATSAVRLADGTYTTLVIPDADVAPRLLPARSGAELAVTPLMLDDGVEVRGTVRDADGRPVAGAQVVLRTGALVSTAGLSDAAGAFRVRAAGGTYGVTVGTALASGTLQAELPPSDGVEVREGATAAPLEIRMAALALATARVGLAAQDPASLGPAARLTVEAETPLVDVARLTVGGGAARAMRGRVLVAVAAGGAAGTATVTIPGLPRGRYRATVFPADASTRDAVTTLPLDLGAGDLVAAGATRLAAKVMVRGKLLPGTAAAGARLLAVDESGVPAAATTDAGAGGAFALAVSPLRRYVLRALPRADQPLARAIFPPLVVADGDLTIADRSMPAGLPHGGRVLDPAQNGVAAALVQAFCTAGAPGCSDATVPVAEAVTRSDGTFQLTLPDPGSAP